jgi:hypothetical protein
MPIINIGGDANNTNAVSLIPDPIYGSGKDGNFTASVNFSLARDMYYYNLTINSGVHVNTAGYRVFVRNILLFNGSTDQDSSTSLGLKNGSNAVGSLGRGFTASVSNSLGGNSASYNAFSPSAIFGGADYFDRPEYAVEGYILNAIQQTPLPLNGGAGDLTNPGGGVVVISARRVSGRGTIYADGFNNGTAYLTGGGVAIYCSSKIKPSSININTLGYTSGSALQFVV